MTATSNPRPPLNTAEFAELQALVPDLDLTKPWDILTAYGRCCDTNMAAGIGRSDCVSLLLQWHHHQAGTIEHALMEARYMGAADFANWCITHDESSFRQERAWFKLKPSLVISYQAELMKNLERIQTNAGLDRDSTVPQLKTQGAKL